VLACIAGAMLAAASVKAQDSSTATLVPVVVRATRDAPRSPLELPFAAMSVQPDSARPGIRHLSLDEMLAVLPGVAVANRTNPAQDPRVFIRGFGSRSAFGVRGVRILRDGMPLTLPDGQTPIDYMDLETIGTVEVIRGSASALYGNAAGGVIDIHSVDPPSDALAVQARALTGSFGLRRLVGLAGGSLGGVGYQATVAHNTSDGYRNYSFQTSTIAFGRAVARAGKTNLSAQLLLYDSPYAQDPGALTKSQLAADPRMADPLWIAKSVRKTATQGQLGVSAARAIGDGEVTASVYGGWRSLDNTRPTFVIDLDRTSYGATFRSTSRHRLGLRHRLTVGVDVQRQSDNRRNDANCNGVVTATTNCPRPGTERGAIVLHQREIVTSLGPFIRDEVEIGSRVRLSAGARGDWVNFQVRDRLVSSSNPDDSGDRMLNRVSPMAGVVARVSPLHAVYANVATAFETPTASELTTKPDGSGGLNPALDPQFATTIESGMKGILSSWLRYDVALFRTTVRDELIQYDVPGVPGRSYYRNAGHTDRRGAELGLQTFRGPIQLSGAWTLSRFRFVHYVAGTTDYSGNRVSAIPAQQGQLAATVRGRGVFATTEMLAAQSAPVDDANLHHVAGYAVFNLRAGLSRTFGNARLSPLVSVYNMFDRKYAGSVVVNAAAGKYYEPAPARSFQIGLTAGRGH
jgi:iron complex outermembrane recepter protein